MAVWLSGVSVGHLSATTSPQSTSAASNYFSAKAAAAAAVTPWILVDSWRPVVLVLLFRGTSAPHPTYGLAGRLGASRFLWS